MYRENGFYHIYNRGVDKKPIFHDKIDYKTFLKYLKEALNPPKIDLQGATLQRKTKNFHNEITLCCFSLMPNHFHLLVKQKEARTIHKFIQSVMIRYAMYFNKRYKRFGPLFQSDFKATNILDDAYLLHITRYIHRNQLKLGISITEGYSSYANYIGKRHTPWVNTMIILDYFHPEKYSMLKHTQSYRDFVENFTPSETEESLNDALLCDENE